MKKTDIVRMVSEKTDWEFYELKDGRILRLDQHGQGKEIYDDIDSAFNELKNYYKEEVYEMLSGNCSDISVETIELHKAFLDENDKKEIIKICEVIAKACVGNDNEVSFNKAKLISDMYK